MLDASAETRDLRRERRDMMDGGRAEQAGQGAGAGAAAGVAGAASGEGASQTTACQRCRKQKLRCSKDKPSCRRCQAISAICSYPAPPNRKLLAAQRAQNAKARPPSALDPGTADAATAAAAAAAAARQDGPGWPSVGDEPASASASGEREGRPGSRDSPSSAALPHTALLQTALPSPDVAAALTNIYLSYFSSATLLFHAETLREDYVAGRVPDFQALSIFALATIFLREADGSELDDLGVPFLSLSDCVAQGEQWASRASQLVLMQADIPRHETISTCQNLATFWLSLGQTERNSMHLLIAYQTCKLLGYHIRPPDAEELCQVHAEVKRRTFWSVWIALCISQDNAPFKGESWKEAVGLPLPCEESSYIMRKPVLKEAFDANGDLVPLDHSEAYSHVTSYNGEIVKLFSLWWEIHRFVKQYAEKGPHDTSKRIPTLQKLYCQLDKINEKMQPAYRFKDMWSFGSGDKTLDYQVFFLQCIYHLCACMLHSSILPVFSSSLPDPQIHKTFSRISARQTVKHSKTLINMATAFLAFHKNRSRLPTLIGYAMFMAATIQCKSLEAQGKLESHSIDHLYPAVSILEELKKHWRTLQGFWTHLDHLFRSIDVDINSLSSTRHLLTEPPETTNIDKIVAHRVVPNLNEASVLYTYSTDVVTKSGSSKDSAENSPEARSASLQARSVSGKGISPLGHTVSLFTGHVIPPVDGSDSIQEARQSYQDQLQHQLHNLSREDHIYPRQDMIANLHSSRTSMNTMSVYTQDGSSFQQSMHGSESVASDLTDMRIGLESTDSDGTGMEGVEMDASNLWWDQSPRGLSVDQFGGWAVSNVTDGANIYHSPGQGR